ncbi:hypothetical protein ACU8KH_01000 [Lachancea thermotolerans]
MQKKVAISIPVLSFRERSELRSSDSLPRKGISRAFSRMSRFLELSIMLKTEFY